MQILPSAINKAFYYFPWGFLQIQEKKILDKYQNATILFYNLGEVENIHVFSLCRRMTGCTFLDKDFPQGFVHPGQEVEKKLKKILVVFLNSQIIVG